MIPADWLKAHGSAADKAGAIKQWRDQMQGKLRVEVARAYNKWKAGTGHAAEKETANAAGLRTRDRGVRATL